MVGSFLLILGFTCILARFLLEYTGEATDTLSYQLRFVGFRAAAIGVTLLSLGLVVG